MEMLTITPTGDGHLYFLVSAPCGSSWLGMRHSNDVRIVVDRALDHVRSCTDCAASDEIRGSSIERGR